jgi:hypothetical protein
MNLEGQGIHIRITKAKQFEDCTYKFFVHHCHNVHNLKLEIHPICYTT